MFDEALQSSTGLCEAWWSQLGESSWASSGLSEARLGCVGYDSYLVSLYKCEIKEETWVCLALVFFFWLVVLIFRLSLV